MKKTYRVEVTHIRLNGHKSKPELLRRVFTDLKDAQEYADEFMRKQASTEAKVITCLSVAH